MTSRNLHFSLLGVALGLLTFAPVARADTLGSDWENPALQSPTTVVVDAQHRSLTLDTTRDYIVKLTPGIDSLPGGLSIWGGHNVVLDGGHIDVPDHAGGMTLKNQTGTIWVHNLHISGPQLMEGVDLDERRPDATVVLRDILVDTVHGSYETNHADLLQTWAGPSRLLIDGFTGITDYQGFFLLPMQYMPDTPPKLFDIRHVDIDNTNGGYALWREGGMRYPLHVEGMYVKTNPTKTSRDWWLWPKPSTGDTSWSNALAGVASAGNFVIATDLGAVGTGLDADDPSPNPGAGAASPQPVRSPVAPVQADAPPARVPAYVAPTGTPAARRPAPAPAAHRTVTNRRHQVVHHKRRHHSRRHHKRHHHTSRHARRAR